MGQIDNLRSGIPQDQLFMPSFGKIVDVCEIDGKKDRKEIVSLTSNAIRTSFGDKYSFYSMIEVLYYNPDSGKYDISKKVYTLPDGKIFVHKYVDKTSWLGCYEVSEDAVRVADMNNDGSADLVIAIRGRDSILEKEVGIVENIQEKRPAEAPTRLLREVIVLYNDGKGNFSEKERSPKKDGAPIIEEK